MNAFKSGTDLVAGHFTTQPSVQLHTAVIRSSTMSSHGHFLQAFHDVSLPYSSQFYQLRA